ncbi:MAG TPA: ABC transporter substrate-binding protein [Dehalococcoidia bacterium]|nr:ABC transporter substrate-binding protein [Dehalococcoidia bacterium]
MPKAKGVFIEGSYGGDAETLNLLLASDGTSFSYIGHTMDSLANYNNELDINLLCLAKDIEVSTDGLTYTVTIRDDLKWSNGSSVTARDYVYTMKNLMFSAWLNYPYKDSWQEHVDGRTVLVQPEVVNDTTFTIRRQTVDPEFVYTIYDLIPYPEYIAIEYEGDVDAFTQAAEFNNLTYTGNLGPYKFKEWIRNDRFVVERNPDYYLGKDIGAPYFEQYVVKQFGTSATMLAALEAGDITLAGIEPQKVSRFKEMQRINVYTVPTGGYTLLAYNQRKNSWEGMSNILVRQALSMSISKELICQKIYLGFAEPAYSFIPVVSPWYDADAVAKYGVGSLHDKQKAIEKFAQAGYAREENGKLQVTDKDGKPVKLILVTTTGGGLAEDIAYLVKQELSEIGIEVELKLVPWENILRKYMMNKVPGSDQTPRDNNGPDAISEEPWDMILMAFGTDVMAPSGSSVFFTSDGGLNFIGYYNPEIDRLFARVKSAEALEETARAEMYAEISNTLSNEQPVDFLVFRRSNIGFQSNVKGVEPGISMSYNYYLWHFE